MRSQFFTYFLSLLLLSACSDSPGETNPVQNKMEHKDNARNKPPSSFSDTITINFPAAVFYNPDSLQLEKIKAITDTMIFESTVHDCFYQMRNARWVLKENWPQIRIVETLNVRYLLFIKSDKSKIRIDLDTKNDMCGLFLFNQIKNPIFVDMTNIGTELDFYFLK